MAAAYRAVLLTRASCPPPSSLGLQHRAKKPRLTFKVCQPVRQSQACERSFAWSVILDQSRNCGNGFHSRIAILPAHSWRFQHEVKHKDM
eukprot:2812469-Pleurochrysis_carterae.AAC.1